MTNCSTDAHCDASPSEALTDQDILDRVETTDPNSETDADNVIKFLEHEKQTTQHS